MKKAVLIIFSFLMVLFLLPGGMASWGGDLVIGGTVTTGEFIDVEPADEPEPDKEEKKEKEPVPSLTEFVLTISTSGQGDTSPGQGSHIYKQGKDVKLNAKPAKGWVFGKWIVGDSEYRDSKISITINKDTNAVAVFLEADSDSKNGDNDEESQEVIGEPKNANSDGENNAEQE